MNAMELSKLETLTTDYAAFQARKSGLATALGGFMALMEVVVIMYVEKSRYAWIWGVCAMPLLWLAAKPLLERWLYRGLGQVKAAPDVAQERRRWLWILGLALFLLVFQTCFLIGFIRWNLECSQCPAELKELPRVMAELWRPWLLGVALPLLYLVAAPFGLRGPEEARAYAVLVAQALFFFLELFGAHGVWLYGTFNIGLALAFLLFQVGLLVWAALAMIRGWKEHREYLALLKAVPDAKEPA